jgi:chemotaxis protein CheX
MGRKKIAGKPVGSDVVAPTRIALPAILDGAEAEPLRQAIMTALSGDGPVVLDGGLTERVATACLQVIMAARRSAQAAHHAFETTNLSPALAAAIADLGLTIDFQPGMDCHG